MWSPKNLPLRTGHLRLTHSVAPDDEYSYLCTRYVQTSNLQVLLLRSSGQGPLPTEECTGGDHLSRVKREGHTYPVIRVVPPTWESLSILERVRVSGVEVYGSVTPNPEVVYIKPLSVSHVSGRNQTPRPLLQGRGLRLTSRHGQSLGVPTKHWRLCPKVRHHWCVVREVVVDGLLED